MQKDIDYVVSIGARSLGDLENQGDKKGIFIGTQKFLFFIPEVSVEHESRKIITTKNSYKGMPITEFFLSKIQEPHLTVSDFEKFITDEIKIEVPSIKIVDLENDIFKFKVVANFFTGSISTNKEDKRIGGWNIFLYSLGKEKKDVRKYYLQHSKLANK